MTVQATSLEAFESIQEKLGEKQRIVLKVIKDHAPLCDKDIARILMWEINRITPRRGELYKKGLIEKAGTKVSEGRKAITWKAVYPNELFD